MALLAGSAYSKYGLDISEFRKSLAEIRAAYADLRNQKPIAARIAATPRNTTSPIIAAEREIAQATRQRAQVQAQAEREIAQIQRDAAQAARQQAREQAQAEREIAQATRQRAQVQAQAERIASTARRQVDSEYRNLSRQTDLLRDSEIRAARATGDHAGALRLIGAELNRAGQGTVRYNQLLIAQARAQKELDRVTNPKPNISAISAQLTGFGNALGAAGIGIGVAQLGQLAIESGRAALQLRQIDSTVRILSGSTERYNDVVAAARNQQLLFGGTLADNLEALSGLVVVSRSSGAALGQLIDISQRLAKLDPSQGIAGARIALNEALSGDPTSLRRRFEIPKEALERLRDTAAPIGERLQVVDEYLTKVGITSEAVSGTVDQAAVSFNTLNQALDDLQTSGGGLLADFFGPAAVGAARLAKAMQGDKQALAELRVAYENSRLGDGKPNVISQTAVDSERLKIAAEELAPALAKARTELNIGQAANRANVLGTTAEFEQAKAGYAGIEQTLIKLASTSTAGTIRARELLDAYTATGNLDQLIEQVNLINDSQAALNATQYAGVPAYIAARQARESAAAKEAAAAAALRQSLALQGDQYLDTKIKGEQFKELQDAIEEQSNGVQSGLIDIGDAADYLSKQYGVARDKVLLFLQAQAPMAGLLAQQAAQTRNLVGGIERFPLGRPGSSDKDVDKVLAAIQAQKDLEAAQRAYAIAVGGTSKELAYLQQDLKNTTDPIEQLRIKTQIAVLQNQNLSASGKGMTAGERADLRLLADDRARLETLRANYAAIANKDSTKAKQILVEIHELEKKITDEQKKQADAALAAQLGTVRDAQARIKEAREAAGLQRALANGTLTEEQSRAAQLRLQEIALEQQKRAIDIQDAQNAAGDALPATPAPVTPIPAPAAPIPAQPVVLPPIPISAQPGALGPVTAVFSEGTIQVLIDGQPIATRVINQLRAGIVSANTSGTGGTP